MSDPRSSDSDQSKRDIPSFIEPRPPMILNPFMRPRPDKGTNLLELFEEDSETEEPEWVQVYLRLKPCNVKSNLYEVKSDRCLITTVDTAPMGHGRRTQHNVSKMYTFSHIFGSESTQREIFEHVVKGNLKKLPDGHNFTLLTYGASGSGKTYTLMGTVQSPGLVPRSLEYVFRLVDAAQQPLYKPADGGANKLDYYEQDYERQFVRKLRQISAPLRDKYRRMSAQLRNDLTTSTFDLTNRTRYYVWVSFVEIYNEAIYDLLSNSDRSKATSKLRIREDASGHVFVKGATQVFVCTGEEAYDVMVAGKHNLQVAATGVHANSSRSHCIFTITMLTETDDGVRTSYVRLCDLAGCERARQTKNTGARMQESRAINSSLHVLERCLHMLRRKQKQKVDATLVPYRESKLTRLLGAGLSGARGEAVSMVVTLNPAPQYACETKHVLQLAAVARDIQVNQTIVESTLESTQDFTMEVGGKQSAEIMKLRADNERLHYELVQAQSRNKELIAAMEEKQQEVAKTMFEIVEEAKDMTRQYYESQLQTLRSEMEEMQEEYENKLKAAADVRLSEGGTPTRKLHKKITELMTEIAILEEKLIAEKLARARAEEEVQHLRACIDERDEKADADSEQNNEEVMSVIESESEEDEDDPYNESLEPTFKKEDINRSRMLQQSILNDSKHDATFDANDNDSDVDKSCDTIKDADEINDDTVRDSCLSDESNTSTGKTSVEYRSMSDGSQIKTKHNDDGINEDIEIETVLDRTQQPSDRGTYVVRDEETNILNEKKVITQKLSKGLEAIDRIKKSMEDMEQSLEKNLAKARNNACTEFADKMTKRLLKKQTRSDLSLFQFEQLEIVSQSDNTKINEVDTFSNIKILKEKRNFFDDDGNENDLFPKLNKERTYFDNIDDSELHKQVNEVKKLLSEDRSPSIVKEDVTGNFEPNTFKKLLGESFTRQPDVISTVKKVALPKKHLSADIFESPQVTTAKETVTSPTQIVTEKVALLENIPDNEDANNVTQNVKAIKDSFHISKEMEKALETNAMCETESNISILEKCLEKASIRPKTENTIEFTRKSLEQMILKEPNDQPLQIKIKEERISVDAQDNIRVLNNKENQLSQANSRNNTIDEFENIYKDLTAPRATEFDLLVSQVSITNNVSNIENEKDFNIPKYNLRHTKIDTSIEKKDTDLKKELPIDKRDRSIGKKKNVSNKKEITVDKKELEAKRDKSTDKKESSNKNDNSVDKNDNIEQVLLESQHKCESKVKPKRNLRLRRRKNQDDEDSDSKLKDVINLQKEYSDVCMDVPAPNKEFKDIESPEETDEVENLSPLHGIQSCPSKTVTRSRRKLFTPRAEPLEESMAQSGDSHERIRVPRPSYHRTTRARRKL